MNRHISFRLFFAVMWRGICQVFEFIGKMLGCKGKSTFAKVVWRIFAGCGALLCLMFTSILLYGFVSGFLSNRCRLHFTAGKSKVIRSEYISNNVVYQQIYKGEDRIVNKLTGKVTLEGLDWLFTSDDRDSLAVFAKDGKRGYVNRFTGEVAIPAQYTKAWVFSEGLAAVEKGRKLMFVDHGGNIVIDRGHEVNRRDEAYTFKHGYCKVRDNVTGLVGLINRNGDWVLDPVYDYICVTGNFIYLSKNSLNGLYNSKMEQLFAVEYEDITVLDSTIMVRRTNDIASIYDLEGNVLQEMVIDEVIPLEYYTNEYRVLKDSDGNETVDEVYAKANCMTYKVGQAFDYGHFGLLSAQGKKLTPPIYTNIEAIAVDRYLCQPHGVILNDRGEPVEK